MTREEERRDKGGGWHSSPWAATVDVSCEQVWGDDTRPDVRILRGSMRPASLYDGNLWNDGELLNDGASGDLGRDGSFGAPPPTADGNTWCSGLSGTQENE
jgi:hypothetical protein